MCLRNLWLNVSTKGFISFGQSLGKLENLEKLTLDINKN